MAVMRRAIVVLLALFTITAGAEDISSAPVAKIVSPPEDVKMLMSTRCQPCHFELRIKPSLLLNTGKWFRMTGDKFEMERRVFQELPPHSMPMGALLDGREQTLLRDWLNRLHKEL